MKYFLIILAGVFISQGLLSQSVDQQADSILNLMTLEEKIGQMTQVERTALINDQDLATYSIGSLLSGGGSSPEPNTQESWANMYDNYQGIALQSNLGIPMIYGIDAVHGHNNVQGAVIFPHNIGMGCTWNTELIKTANEIVASEVAATGIDWTFAPCIAVARNERWGRTYEGFGETPEIQKLMAEASVVGLQGTDLSLNETILACAKHYVGDGGTTDGIDQGNTQMSEDSLRQIHMQGYIDAIDAGVGTVMASFNSWNGDKLHGHQYLLTDVLKNELGFEGFVISDWAGVDQIDEDYRTAIKRAINAGIDMVMVPDRYEVFISHLTSLVNDGEVSETRIDDAVLRILKQKLLLDLFENPYSDNATAGDFGSQTHRDVARQVVRESMVLLNAKNDVLPLQKNGQNILVAGELAADLGAQCGGWTISWQGNNGDITTGTNIIEGINNLTGTSEVVYAPDGNYNTTPDVAVVVVGEKIPYAEGEGDRTALNLDETDIQLMKKLKKAGIPTVAVLISGRPMIFGELLPYTDAVLAAWYPGTEGEGVAEVLYGDYQPSGMLTHSWPKAMWQVPVNFGDNLYDPLFAYKHGLQEFPASAGAAELLAYAATTNKGGDSLILTLSDEIETMNATVSDFTIEIDGVTIPDMLGGVSIAGYDESALVFTLNTLIEPGQKITISYSGNNITASDLVLGNFDGFYVHNAVGGTGIWYAVPGRLEAEHFFEMEGIQTEACSDVGGGENVGYIDPGDWMKYKIQVAESGFYTITGRLAGYSNGTLLIRFNDTIETGIDYTATDGWQTWQDFSTWDYLEAGTYTMEVIAQTNALNINYFDFELYETGIDQPVAHIQNIKVYPNPVSNNVTVDFSNTLSHQASIKLIDATGKYVEQLYHGSLTRGDNSFTFPVNEALPAGIYFIEIKDGVRRYFEKIIKQ